jgi:hypothetical protein
MFGKGGKLSSYCGNLEPNMFGKGGKLSSYFGNWNSIFYFLLTKLLGSNNLRTGRFFVDAKSVTFFRPMHEMGTPEMPLRGYSVNFLNSSPSYASLNQVRTVHYNDFRMKTCKIWKELALQFFKKLFYNGYRRSHIISN